MTKKYHWVRAILEIVCFMNYYFKNNPNEANDH